MSSPASACAERVRTTVPDPAASQVPDLFQRDFTAAEPGLKTPAPAQRLRGQQPIAHRDVHIDYESVSQPYPNTLDHPGYLVTAQYTHP
ncbi:hypothetical protein [Streptomyces sp. NEAU-W12]|uniref:hypothetical protein n=1 Tax=Streptomyces sp. NEAU-W12 TaxID=2994668 RepID=UPI00224A9993|nr:hypothetical protein [Streptomyces sp. NEAU-W12]MCX2928442.1 hypothetical protein [Streptomyces sp. NEAU-W12]